METSLSQRIAAYLKKQGDGIWVSKHTIQSKAKESAYYPSAIDDAFIKLDNMSDIGKKYADGSTAYCWYDTTEEYRDHVRRQHELWESL